MMPCAHGFLFLRFSWWLCLEMWQLVFCVETCKATSVAKIANCHYSTLLDAKWRYPVSRKGSMSLCPSESYNVCRQWRCDTWIVTAQWWRTGCRLSPYRHSRWHANVVPPSQGPPFKNVRTLLPMRHAIFQTCRTCLNLVVSQGASACKGAGLKKLGQRLRALRGLEPGSAAWWGVSFPVAQTCALPLQA